MKKYEAEFKAEISREEHEFLPAVLAQRGFAPSPRAVQRDSYVEASLSPHGGHDFKRYRDEGSTVFFTEKRWDDAGRMEDEREATREEMQAALEKGPPVAFIEKERRKFTSADGTMVIDMDMVRFDPSADPRFFIEAEILTEDKDEVAPARIFLREYLEGLLGRDVSEAESMLAMAMQHVMRSV